MLMKGTFGSIQPITNLSGQCHVCHQLTSKGQGVNYCIRPVFIPSDLTSRTSICSLIISLYHCRVSEGVVVISAKKISVTVLPGYGV